jgi:hypothetical protein
VKITPLWRPALARFHPVHNQTDQTKIKEKFTYALCKNLSQYNTSACSKIYFAQVPSGGFLRPAARRRAHVGRPSHCIRVSNLLARPPLPRASLCSLSAAGGGQRTLPSGQRTLPSASRFAVSARRRWPALWWINTNFVQHKHIELVQNTEMERFASQGGNDIHLGCGVGTLLLLVHGRLVAGSRLLQLLLGELRRSRQLCSQRLRLV